MYNNKPYIPVYIDKEQDHIDSISNNYIEHYKFIILSNKILKQRIINNNTFGIELYVINK